MPSDVDLRLHNRQRAYAIPIKRLRTYAMQALDQLRSIWPAELDETDIYFVGERRIRELHAEFLGDPTPTDVITFHHGEIFICPAVADDQRQAHRLTLQDELLIYMIHGLLHLCGYQDKTPAQFKRMAQAQNRLFKKIRST